MPPRRSRRAQGQHPAAATIGWLGDDLLAKCFSLLGQADLLSRAALVCCRWHAVSTRPELLQNVVFHAGRDGAAAVRAAQSLLRLLQQHGQAVRSLDLALEEYVELSAVGEMEVLSLLDGCVTVCAGSLERLKLHLMTGSYMLGAWTATAHRLEELRLEVEIFTVWATLEHLTSLRRLHLYAERWQLGSAMALPASLTRLRIEEHKAEEMPAQVGHK
ncbi:hypothetical protein CHLNCDRAFT_55445 [Chlorella variabilis]|uniref:Uncharacterized protein n=1 Tax=Chlorella variabilis TaxID=554065 RepID=E1ZT84_CHLVA|nr:hypothetical protein CHLNCDRAFT_55445 [Chlorella variabilis]EFN50954.1 hypothetical protein CHLNCDRAFT_55445 [Chlorella variabilis]|eukprot:XP_005843056.1 hypothetical protein CHLNCDRAFT_55445 [Chlorella variabilis]